MNNDAGWNGSGGQWVPLDQAMQVIVTSEKQVQGGKKFEGELPKPRANAGFYRDIAVLAFPTPADPTNPAYRITNLKGKGMSYGWLSGRIKVGPDVPAAMGVLPDFASSRPLRHIHRDLDGMDIYFVANPDPLPADAVCTFRVSGKTPEAWFPDTGRIEPISVFEETNGCTRIPLRFEPAGSMFIVFKKGNVKASERIVSVKRNGQELVKMSETDAKNATGDVSQVPPLDLVNREISQNGTYEIKTADEKSRQVAVTDLPAPQEIKGPWEVKFAPGLGAPEKIVLDDLVSWSRLSDSGVRYFSGSATYRKLLELPQSQINSGKPEVGNLKSKMYLELGKVTVMTKVKLNGKNLGILWKAPYSVDITDSVKAGENDLEIRVVNLPVNRMIGDEFLPEDSERNKNGTLRKWPPVAGGGKAKPDRALYVHELAVVEKGRTAAGIRPAGSCDCENGDAAPVRERVHLYLSRGH